MSQAPASPVQDAPEERTSKRLRLGSTLRFLGPAFLVSVGYMDPGNWATNIQAGAQFGYTLLWVLLASNLTAIFLQSLSAKLGIATDKNLAENCRAYFPGPVALGLGLTAIAACIATNLAEVLGAALAFNLLFGLPTLIGASITVAVSLVVLALYRFGYRRVEALILTCIGVVGSAYIYEVWIAKPDWQQVAYHTVVPQLNGSSLLIAAGLLGATVMPHNLFLHSDTIQTRLKESGDRREVQRLSWLDTGIALNLALLVNAAMLIMAASVFFKLHSPVETIEQASRTLEPLLGRAASTVFGVALLASGLASTVTGTQAGEEVLKGFLPEHFNSWVRRAIVLVPAVALITLGVDALQVLVTSQVVLSMQLPFTVVPLILLTRRREVMGDFVNRPWMSAIAWVMAVLVVLLNGFLLYETFFSHGG